MVLRVIFLWYCLIANLAFPALPGILATEAGVQEFLESLFGRKVDLVMKSTLKSRLRESILREAVRAA